MSHDLRFSSFASANKMQQQQQQQQRKSMTPTSIPKPIVNRTNKEMSQGFSDTDDDGQDIFDDVERSSKLSREERYVLLHQRAEPQGQENLSGNVTPVNESQPLNIYEKVVVPPVAKNRFSSTSLDSSTNQQHHQTLNQRYGSTPSQRNISIHDQQNNVNNGNGGGSLRNSLIQNSNRNSMDHSSQSNRSSLDVSQSSYNTLIIHDNNDQQPIFQASNNPPALIRNEIFYINSSPSPPNYGMKQKDNKQQSGRSSFVGPDVTMTPISENEQQYLNQSYVLKHLAKEVRMPKNILATNSDNQRDSDNQKISDNNNNNNNNINNNNNNRINKKWSNSMRNKSKSQPDLTKYCNVNDSNESDTNSTTNTLNFNDFEQLEVENTKLRQQLNDCIMKVAKSQKLEQEVTNIYRVHEELLNSCERRERLERTARNRLQNDCGRLQELNRTLREQVELLQTQLLTLTQQQQQHIANNSGRTHQDVLIQQLIQQNKDLVDANKRQYIEIQAQSATLEEQRIHINVLDNALKRLEEECRQKQLYQKQLQHALQSLQNSTTDRRDKLRLDLETDYATRDINRNVSTSTLNTGTDSATANLKWQLREKDNQIMRLEAECSKLEQQRNTNLDESQLQKLANLDKSSQENTSRIIAEAQAQRKVNELQTRLKIVENRLAEKEKQEVIKRQLQEQKLYSGGSSVGNSYSLLSNNTDCYTTSASSIVSTAPTTPLIYNATNFDQLISTDYSTLYGHHPEYRPKLSSHQPSSPNTSCSSSTSTAILQLKPQSTQIAANYLNYDQSLDEQRKTIDDQLKQLDGELMSKVSELFELQQKQNMSMNSRNNYILNNTRDIYHASNLSIRSESPIMTQKDVPKIRKNDNNYLNVGNNSLANSIQSLSLSMGGYRSNTTDNYTPIINVDDSTVSVDTESEVFY